MKKLIIILMIMFLATPSYAQYAQWKLNETTGTTVTDSAGSNDGTASVNASNLTVVGQDGTAFEFNGSEYVDISTVVGDIASDTTGTISFWVKPPAGTTNAGRLFSISDASSNNRLIVRFSSTNKLRFECQNNSTQIELYTTANNTLPADTWTFLTIVQNGTAPVVYINGESEAFTYGSNSDITAWLGTLSGLDVGYIATGEFGGAGKVTYYTGIVDDVRYYQNDALDASEVLALYNSYSESRRVIIIQ